MVYTIVKGNTFTLRGKLEEVRSIAKTIRDRYPIATKTKRLENDDAETEFTVPQRIRADAIINIVLPNTINKEIFTVRLSMPI